MFSTPRISVLRKRCHNQGFALVVALSLMAFVLLLILSISTFVQVEMASANIGVAKLEAEQAALLSLNVAIGKLQETAGLDQRVTAPAEAAGRTELGAKQLTGVWRSWEGLDHQANGLPIAPDYASKLVTGDQGIDSSNTGRFLGWLTSSAYDPAITETVGFNSPPDLTEVSGQTVALVGAGTVGSDADGIANQIHAEPTLFDDGRGAFAWWISGENTKALLLPKTESSDVSDWTGRILTAAAPDESVFDITDASHIDRVFSRNSLNELPNDVNGGSNVSGKYFHDLTAYSRGLLTNTANGGWRRDLSLLSEQWSELELNNLPFYSLSPGVETSASKASGNAHEVLDLIYPWAGASSSASVSWNALVDFAKQYEYIEASPTSGISQMSSAYFLDADTGSQRDRVSRSPILARIHYIMSLSSESVVGGYNPCVILSPVITLWNPHSVGLNADYDLKYRLYESTPLRMTFDVDGTEYGPYGLGQLVQGDDRISTMDFSVPISNDPIWQPGEVRVYSASGSGISAATGITIDLEIGYRTDTGIRFVLQDGGTAIVADGASSFSVTAVDTSATRNTNVNFGAGAYMQISKDGAAAGNMNIRIPLSDVAKYWSDGMDLKSGPVTLSAIDSGSKAAAFFSVIYGLRTASDPYYDDSIPLVKPFFDMNPLRMSYHKDLGSLVGKDLAALEFRLEAYPYDWTFIPINDINSADAPSGIDGELTGYLGSSFRASEGLNNMIISELPTRPLRSLGELQHFQINATNDKPPYTMNAIGNSSASAFIPAADVVVGAEAAASAYDNSYVSNHLLFDDWFVSSIAPETLENSSSISRSKETVYADFISGQTALPNSSYLPADFVLSADADSVANELLDHGRNPNGWHDIAAELEVEGMFNVNSTSVAAWTSILRHLNDGSVPYLNSGVVSLASDFENPVSRTTLAGDPAAASDSGYANLGTHTGMTNVQVEALAEEIVQQIKARGPFLSLSEFINRQLIAGNIDLSLAGAIEAALTELSNEGDNKNPFSSLQGDFVDEVSLLSDTSFLSFIEATAGNLSYGFPGWIRQADILRPLAPKLSVRDDTFVIRCYGSSMDRLTGKTNAQVWCEAVVQRRADYVESAVDEKTVLPGDHTLQSEINKRFGRRFSVISFRWLSEDEV